MLSTNQFAGWLAQKSITSAKGIGTCDALLCVAHTLQSALEIGQDDRMVQIDFMCRF